MAQQFENDFGGQVAEKLMHVDVRIAGVNKREVTQLEREQGRIDWKDRNSANMKKIAEHEVTPIYQ
ncbi:hypothetical protein [Gordonibacter massiliensis (ex Traore et al. 2017)]|uniref:Uncharacterized protein n=1 Tax=Gordonibacter massiliensis (ex Traore et al. 2017) TaxID=1841863 RepID=A0A842JMF7_9ACTN|nr:hypothetical protein [Gordonibacter massiliensis (ex Traore et al. 2017)]MBC2890390.1 hypothetical protein [Gordonibacter massiliensis (ex Traore et al. 2017)]